MSDEPGRTIDLPRLEGLARPQRSGLAGSGSSGTSRNGQRTFHAVVGGLLVLLVLLVPIPLGSVYPVFSAGIVALAGLIGIVYALGLLMIGGKLRQSVRPLGLEALLFLAFTGALSTQLMPVSSLLPGLFRLPDALGGALPPQPSLDPGATGGMLVGFGGLGLLFYLVSQVAANRGRARTLLVILFVGLCGHAAYALLALSQFGDTVLGAEKTTYLGFATGTFINRNSFATLMAMGASVGAGLAVDQAMRGARDGWVGRAIRIGLVLVGEVLLLITLLATGSRMGTLAGFSGVGLVVLFGFIGLRPRLRVVALAGLAVLIAAILLGALFGETVLTRAILQSMTEDARVDLHRQVWAAIWQRPWTGYGGASFASVFPAFSAPPLSGEVIFDRSHSTYLALWFDMGLVAGSLPLLIIASAALRLVRRLGDGGGRAPLLAALGVIAVAGVHSLMDFSLELYANAVVFTFILAVGLAGARPKPEGA